MKKSIGIDLGTTNSVVSFKDAILKIIPNKEGEELTRSCVGVKKGEMLVGSKAYKIIRTEPTNTVLSIKRLMGGAIKDKMVQEMISSPYYKYGITALKGGTEDAVAAILGGKQYTPEQISAEILKKLKADAEKELGDEVTHAVITVPAYFTEKQKNATKIAAQLAGLKVQKLLAEPTAAAIAYGVDNLKSEDAKSIMIYDFGGGTFDLSILNIVDGQYMEAGTGGDRWLGGDDLDKELQKFVLKKVANQYHLNNIEQLIANLPEKERYQFEGEFRGKTEEAKIKLSTAQTANIYIDNLLEDENEEVIDIDVTITRNEFEKLVRPFIERSIELIEVLLKEVGYEMSMIDNVLLVGGTSCIPLVKQMLSEKYGPDKILVSEKPMLAVAQGAAILSHRLDDAYETPISQEADIDDISYSTNHNYFIELKDGFDKIMEKQMPLPYNITRNYKTTVNNQKIVQIAVYADVEESKKEKQTIGFFTIEDNLPLGSDIILDITLGVDELFQINAYPKNNKAKAKNIVLARGNKDSKALKFLSDSLDKIAESNFNESQREFFFKSAQKQIEQINRLNPDEHDSEKWNEIGTAIFTSFEQAEQITDSVNEDQYTILFATILVNEYSDLIGINETNQIKNLLVSFKNDNDPLQKIQATQKLKEITDNYSVLIALFTVKITANTAATDNPADGQKLLQMHEQVVNKFKQGDKDEAFRLLDEALELRDKYGSVGTVLNTYLGK